jgi:hypothetical protein
MLPNPTGDNSPATIHITDHYKLLLLVRTECQFSAVLILHRRNSSPLLHAYHSGIQPRSTVQMWIPDVCADQMSVMTGTTDRTMCHMPADEA